MSMAHMEVEWHWGEVYKMEMEMEMDMMIGNNEIHLIMPMFVIPINNGS